MSILDFYNTNKTWALPSNPTKKQNLHEIGHQEKLTIGVDQECFTIRPPPLIYKVLT